MEEYTNYLIHHGIKGQRWGVRRYQNPDGSLTAEGKARLGTYKQKQYKKLNKKYDNKIARQERKIIKRSELGKSTDKAVTKHALLVGRKAVEELALDKMSYNNMIEEKKAVRRNIGRSALRSVGGLALASATGFGFVSIPSNKGARETQRWKQTGVSGFYTDTKTGKVMIDMRKKKNHG